MSKLSADNLRARAAGMEVPMVYPVRGSAKAWALLNGTGTVALLGSLNVASAVDNGTGDYSFNFTTGMSGTNYSTPSSAACVNVSSVPAMIGNVAGLAGNCRTRTSINGSALLDCFDVSVAIQGELA